MVSTRRSKVHSSIRSTHPRSKSRYRTTSKPLPSLCLVLQRHIRRVGVKPFLVNAVRGDITVGKAYGDMKRNLVLRILDEDGATRGLVSSLWRQETPHCHEWVPCTYLYHLMKRAIVAGDFRFLLLADAMRTATQSLIFKPRPGDRNIVSTRCRARNIGLPMVLQAHPGGLRFNRAPAGAYLAEISRFNPGSFLTGYSQLFHDEIIKALKISGPPDLMLNGIYTVFKRNCWDGGAPAAGLWQYYTRGGGAAVTPANFVSFRAAIKAEYKVIENNFNGFWRTIAVGKGRIPPAVWR